MGFRLTGLDMKVLLSDLLLPRLNLFPESVRDNAQLRKWRYDPFATVSSNPLHTFRIGVFFITRPIPNPLAHIERIIEKPGPLLKIAM